MYLSLGKNRKLLESTLKIASSLEEAGREYRKSRKLSNVFYII